MLATPGEREDRGDARSPAAASNDGDGDRANKLDGDGGAQGNARDSLVERRVHREDDDPEERGDRQVRDCEAAAPRALPREENHRACEDAPPRNGGGFDRGESDDRERRANVLDESRADEEELRRDTVGDSGDAGAPGGVLSLGGREGQGRRVHAVTHAGGLAGGVGEDMTQV